MTDINWGLLKTPDYASGAINAFRVGREDRKARVEENAFAKYAQDPNGAINELMAVNPDAAMKLRQQGQQDGDRQAKVRGATALANNDYTGAAAAFGDAGDAASVMSANAAQADRLEKQHEYMRIIAPGLLKSFNEGGDVSKDFESAIPILKRLHVDDDAIKQLRDGFAADPKGSVAAIMATAQRKIEYRSLGDEVIGIDTNTNQEVGRWRGNRYIAVPEGGKLVPTGGMGGTSGGPGAAPAQAQGQAPAGGFDGFYSQYLAPAEGGYAANDGNGAPVNFGINQKSNPDVDVSKLTQAQAKQLTYERYWKPSGADQLPPGLAEVHADTAFNMGQEPAQRLLQASGGDIGKYFQLREQRYRSIAAANPDKARYLPTWLDRNEKLRSYVNGQGGAGQAAPTQQAQAGGRGMNERGDPVGTIYGNPKQQARPATAEEKKAYGIPADVPAKMGPNGIDILSGVGVSQKPIPRPVMQGYLDNQASIGKLGAALAALNAYPNAVGLSRVGGENINQRIDPKGVDVRAAIADVGSLIIHDRSGAAVTLSESPRLMPFIPTVTDTADAARKKLTRLLGLVQEANSGIAVAYDPGEGYQPLPQSRGASTPGAGRTDAPGKPMSVPKPARSVYEAGVSSGRFDTKAKIGTETHPYVARDMATANRLSKGTYVILPNGAMGVVE